MKIAVPVKYTPDTETKVKIGADGKSINPDGVSFVMNPYDEFALEEALKIKEAGEAEVTVFTIGDDESAKALKTGMAMGADKAVLIKTATPADSLQAAGLLANALKDGGWDIILMGMKAVDSDSGAVGPMTAELLGLPCVTMITKLEISGGKAVARREAEIGMEVIETSLPAVFTAQKGLNEPRYASLKGIMRAKKQPIDEITSGDAAVGTVVIEMRYPPERPAGKIVGEGVEAVPELVKLLKEEAKVL